MVNLNVWSAYFYHQVVVISLCHYAKLYIHSLTMWEKESDRMRERRMKWKTLLFWNSVHSLTHNPGADAFWGLSSLPSSIPRGHLTFYRAEFFTPPVPSVNCLCVTTLSRTQSLHSTLSGHRGWDSEEVFTLLSIPPLQSLCLIARPAAVCVQEHVFYHLTCIARELLQTLAWMQLPLVL